MKLNDLTSKNLGEWLWLNNSTDTITRFCYCTVFNVITEVHYKDKLLTRTRSFYEIK